MYTLVLRIIFLFLDLAPIVLPILIGLTHAAMGFGLYKMAKTCQIARPWMSWIPYANFYLAGEIADHYCYRNEDRKTTYRRRLLTWSIVATILLGLILCAMYIVIIFIPILAASVLGQAYPSLEYLLSSVLKDPTIRGALVAGTLGILLVLGLYILYFFLSFRKGYLLFAPKRSTLFTVLSILVPLSAPVIFVILAFKTPIYSEDSALETMTDPVSP